MSVRAVEDRFSLRTVVAEETASKPLVLVQTPLTGNDFSTKRATKPGLKFDFSQLKKTAPMQSSEKVAAIALMDSGRIPMNTPLKNPFGHTNDASRADVMRLTAVVEDLNIRLKKSIEKANAAETQLKQTQIAFIAERSSVGEKMKSMSAQLGSARAVETQLRDELSKTSKSLEVQKASIPKFEAAVAAAVAADGVADKSQKEVERLKEQLAISEQDVKRLGDEVVSFQEQNAEMSSKVVDLERQVASAKQELHNAKEAQVKAVSELSETTERVKALEISVQPTSCCPNCDTKENSEPLVDTVVEMVKPSSTEPQLPPSFPDPIKMHARYNRLRDAVNELTSVIESMKASDKLGDDLNELISKRDELYSRAKDLKLRYETIFGAAEPESVVELSGDEKFSTIDTNEEVKEIDEISYAPEGDAPSPHMNYVISFAREMSQSCPLGGAFDFGSLDSGACIGSLFVNPITVGGEVVEPTEGHDATKDMVDAVVRDLTKYLQDVKARDAVLDALMVPADDEHVDV